jgi:uncharacterized Zn finger protein
VLKAIGAFFRRIGDEIASESREWLIRCDRCGRERSVWATGGVRYKASGRKRTVAHCSSCGTLRTMTIYHPVKAPLR